MGPLEQQLLSVCACVREGVMVWRACGRMKHSPIQMNTIELNLDFICQLVFFSTPAGKEILVFRQQFFDVPLNLYFAAVQMTTSSSSRLS